MLLLLFSTLILFFCGFTPDKGIRSTKNDTSLTVHPNVQNESVTTSPENSTSSVPIATTEIQSNTQDTMNTDLQAHTQNEIVTKSPQTNAASVLAPIMANRNQNDTEDEYDYEDYFDTTTTIPSDTSISIPITSTKIQPNTVNKTNAVFLQNASFSDLYTIITYTDPPLTDTQDMTRIAPMYTALITSINTTQRQTSTNTMASLRTGLQLPFTPDDVRQAFFRFAMDLSEVVFEGRTSNVMIPTLSVAMFLSMLSYGARGSTRRDLSKILGLPVDDTNSTIIKTAIKEFVQSMKEYSPSLALTSINFIDDNKTIIKSEFRDTAETIFSVMYNSSSVSDYLKEPNVEFTSNFDLNPGLSLSSYIDFRGSWSMRFDPTMTTTFYMNDNISNGADNSQRDRIVHIMHQCNIFPHGTIESYGFKFIELPFKSNNAMSSMLILLPMGNQSISTIGRNLHNLSYDDFRKNTRSDVLCLSMPKIQFSSKFQLHKEQRMFGSIFNATADFTGISDDDSLKVKHIQLAARFLINEDGMDPLYSEGKIFQLRQNSAEPFDVRPPFIALIVHREVVLFSASITYL